jgi:hypothetical protein
LGVPKPAAKEANAKPTNAKVDKPDPFGSDTEEAEKPTEKVVANSKAKPAKPKPKANPFRDDDEEDEGDAKEKARLDKLKALKKPKAAPAKRGRKDDESSEESDGGKAKVKRKVK